ncbi:MAG TPA: hypothetical protein VH370_09650 [Humisphaera sp.]|jgi:hypothetical protein|nr:hypothetical protein [Humisphaera sp.]
MQFKLADLASLKRSLWGAVSAMSGGGAVYLFASGAAIQVYHSKNMVILGLIVISAATGVIGLMRGGVSTVLSGLGLAMSALAALIVIVASGSR